MRTLIKNARIVTSKEILEDYLCVFSGGIITYIGQEMQEADQVIDAEHNYLIPGFVDLHCHGCLNKAFVGATEAEFAEMADFHLAHGTTTMLASTSTAGAEETLGTLETFRKYKEAHPDRPAVSG